MPKGIIAQRKKLAGNKGEETLGINNLGKAQSPFFGVSRTLIKGKLPLGSSR